MLNTDDIGLCRASILKKWHWYFLATSDKLANCSTFCLFIVRWTICKTRLKDLIQR